MASPPTVIQQPDVVVPQADTNEWQQMLYELQQIRVALSEEGLQEEVQLTLEKEGVSIQISTPMLFEPAEAELRAPSTQLLDRLSVALQKLDTEIRVEGHTDNVPINSEQFPSNWELSSARATAVLKYLIDRGLPPERLAAVGYGEFRPIDTNETEAGRHRNRRVEIFVRRTDGLARSVQRVER
jgi:chemotaxis protein MotB